MQCSNVPEMHLFTVRLVLVGQYVQSPLYEMLSLNNETERLVAHMNIFAVHYSEVLNVSKIYHTATQLLFRKISNDITLYNH